MQMFDPELKTISEFLERFSVTNEDILGSADTFDKNKVSLLIKSLPIQIVTDFQRRIKPKLTEAYYKAVSDKLTSQFVVKKSMVGATVQFLNRKQQINENIETFAKILNELGSSNCNYKECCRDRLLRDSFIAGLESKTIVGVDYISPQISATLKCIFKFFALFFHFFFHFTCFFYGKAGGVRPYAPPLCTPLDVRNSCIW